MNNRRTAKAYSIGKHERQRRRSGWDTCTSDREQHNKTDRRETRRVLRTHNFWNLEES
jgi:hypothetical protein